MLSHTRRKNSLDSQSAFCTHSVAYILYQVHILYPVCSLHFVLTGIRGTNTVFFYSVLICSSLLSYGSFSSLRLICMQIRNEELQKSLCGIQCLWKKQKVGLLFICVWELLISQISLPTGILPPFFGAIMSRTR